ncbi:hypothetical protein [Pelobacter propionicus]|uniref:hypothetical protein n=1 Tax=Pelobacter propionicus TaxID=29543 RepID=UPI00031317CF|nr:hypothetical protein [Pelobacter propionicus]
MKCFCAAMPLIALLEVLLSADVTAAAEKRNGGKRPYRDVYGNAYRSRTNIFRDRDKNGVLNLFQQDDRFGRKPRKSRNSTKQHR